MIVTPRETGDASVLQAKVEVRADNVLQMSSIHSIASDVTCVKRDPGHSNSEVCIIRTDKNDNLIRTPNSDCIDGKGGNDRISGLAGNDKLTGRDGRDLLGGGNGNDELAGGKGANRFDCGDGTDKITETP